MLLLPLNELMLKLTLENIKFSFFLIADKCSPEKIRSVSFPLCGVSQGWKSSLDLK